MAEIEPIWCWQVLDDDGRWGTISVYLAEESRMITGDGKAHNLVLQTRTEAIARGPYLPFAELHKKFGKPVRLHRFIPDPDFVPETL